MKFLSDSAWKVILERLDDYERRIIEMEKKLSECVPIISIDLQYEDDFPDNAPANDAKPKLTVVSDNTK